MLALAYVPYYIISVIPPSPTITGNVGTIEETKPLVATCTTTGSRPGSNTISILFQ
jgi:hypothetical protein